MNFDVYFHHVFVLFKDKAGIIMKQNKNGFTLMEMLIVIAIIAVLIAVAIPVFASQLEKTREATDLANVRSAYAQVSTEALLGDSEATVTVNLKQKQADWQSLDPVNIGGIVHYKNQGDTDNWKGVAAPNGTCVVSYKEDYGIILTWSGKADSSKPEYPFNTNETDFFSLLYNTDFWKSGSIKTIQTLSLTPDVRIRNMFHPLSQRLKSWITVFCSSLIAHGPILATEKMDKKQIGIFSGHL